MNTKIKKIKDYIIPISVGVVLMLIVSTWIYNENKAYKKQTLEIINNEGDVITEAIKGIIQSQMRRHRINKDILHFLLNRIIDRTSLRYIDIYIDNNKLCTFGNIQPNSKLRKKQSKIDYKNKIFAYSRKIDFERLPPPPPRIMKAKYFKVVWDENKERKEFDSFYNFRNKKAEIVIGIDISPFLQQLKQQTFRLFLIYFISLLAITVFIITWIFIFKNIRMKIELEKAKDKTEKLEELGLAAAGLAHEVKNPLGIIRGFAQEISKKSYNDLLIKEVADKIIDEADVTTERLSDFMNYAKHRPIQLEKFNIKIYLVEIIEILRPEFEDSCLSVELSAEDFIIEADRDYLNKILINILLNSIQACSENNKILIDVLQSNGIGSITISDNGPGIDENLIKDIFKPYVSGYSNGHGIGLTIVKKLIEESGWNIVIYSATGKGTQTVISGIKAVKK